MYQPVLMYHEIIKEEASSREIHAVTLKEFKRHMRYLKEIGAHSIDFKYDFEDCLLFDKKDCQAIGISFDDGNLSDYREVVPVLKEYGFRGIFFVTLEWIGTPRYLQWKDLREMDNVGMSIQSHGVTHRFLPRLNDVQLRAELRSSKLELEDRLGNEVRFLSLPGGFGSRRVYRTAREEGYSAVFTSEPCLHKTIQRDLGIIGRFNVTRLTSDDAFKSMVNLDRDFIKRLRRAYKAKGLVKAIVGSKIYYFVWRTFKRELRR